MEEQQAVKITQKNIEDLKGLNIYYYSKEVLKCAEKKITRYNIIIPIVIDKNNNVLIGGEELLALKNLGYKHVPTIEIENLSEAEAKAFSIAHTNLQKKIEYDYDQLKFEIQDILNCEDIKITNEDLLLSSIELDNILFDLDFKTEEKAEKIEIIPDEIPQRVKSGDLIKLGSHLLLCGNALKSESYNKLLGSDKADIVITDPPYNVKVADNVTKQKHHKEFAMASGEMTDTEYDNFLHKGLSNIKQYSTDGAVIYIFMDWRHVLALNVVCNQIFSKQLNLCVWNKINGGMGSFYRSQHELCLVYQNGQGKHKNNIELGKNGRNRSNVWDYKGMSTSTKQAKALRKLHPTVKPTAMLMDIMLDASKYGDIVLDCFGGSGSTLIAAEQCGRKARLIELSPHYCDVIIARWEKLTGLKHEIISNVEVING